MPIYRTREYGPSGFASVKVERDKVLVEFAETHQTYSIFKEDAPENIITEKYFVTLNQDGTKITGMRPPKGTYFAHFANFTHKKDEPPTFKDVPADIKRKKDNTTYAVPAHLEFTAIFDIDKGKFGGFQVPYSMWYCFKPYGTTGESAISGRGRGKVEEFLLAVGFDFMADSIPYSENVLPELEQAIRERKGQVVLVLNEYGYVDSIAEAPLD